VKRGQQNAWRLDAPHHFCQGGLVPRASVRVRSLRREKREGEKKSKSDPSERNDAQRRSQLSSHRTEPFRKTTKRKTHRGQNKAGRAHHPQRTHLTQRVHHFLALVVLASHRAPTPLLNRVYFFHFHFTCIRRELGCARVLCSCGTCDEELGVSFSRLRGNF
jgi:hypothetical protein